jgi:hypothetical protein
MLAFRKDGKKLNIPDFQEFSSCKWYSGAGLILSTILVPEGIYFLLQQQRWLYVIKLRIQKKM